MNYRQESMNNPRPDEKLYRQDRSEVAMGLLFCFGAFIMLVCESI